MAGLSLSLGRGKRRASRGGGGAAAVPFNPLIVSASSLDFNNNAANNPTAGPWTITLPARSIGDRLILLTNRRVASGGDFNLAGWTQLIVGGTSTNDTRALYRDITAGNVADATAVVTSTSSGTPSQSLIWRLSGCDPTVAPVANGLVQGGIGVGTLNPPSLTGPNAGAVQRNLWLAYIGMAGQQNANGTQPVIVAGGWPTGYGDTGTSTTTVATALNGAGQGWGSKVATAGSDDPSTWTYQTGITQYYAFAITVAVRGVLG